MTMIQSIAHSQTPNSSVSADSSISESTSISTDSNIPASTSISANEIISADSSIAAGTNISADSSISANEKALYSHESHFSVDETMTRLENELKQMQMPVFALIDHSKNAKEVGLEMNPSKVIIFGSPKVGTPLMQDNPSIALALPLKIAVYQDNNEKVWITFTKMIYADKTYPLKDTTILEKMDQLLTKLTIKAASN